MIKTIGFYLTVALIIFGYGFVSAEISEPVESSWNVEGVERSGILYLPKNAKTTACPVVFVFHGHYGTAKQAAGSLAIHEHWPEAIVVFLQGLKTPGQIMDKEGRGNGWQAFVGDQSDRDLKFFDAVLEWLKKEYRVDVKKIFCTGHSNGGGFTYLLWFARGEIFAALAPSSATPGKYYPSLKPKPVLHVAGENDETVKYAWQEKTMEFLKKLNDCEAGKPWGQHLTFFVSKSGNPLITYVHPGGHTYAADASAWVVKFFKNPGNSLLSGNP